MINKTKWLRKLLVKHRRDMIDYNFPMYQDLFDTITKIKSEVDFAMRYPEAISLAMLIKETSHIKGNICAVGIFEGGSAKLICEVKKNKKAYFFDTFEGHPELEEVDQQNEEGQFNVNVEDVRYYLKDYSKVEVHKGYFPKETGHFIQGERFSFVHLDVNLYKSTKECIEFFYNRLNPEGIMLIDDYDHCEGVRKAVDEIFKGKKTLILLNSNQVLIKK